MNHMMTALLLDDEDQAILEVKQIIADSNLEESFEKWQKKIPMVESEETKNIDKRVALYETLPSCGERTSTTD